VSLTQIPKTNETSVYTLRPRNKYQVIDALVISDKLNTVLARHSN
jgi:hypothetical protein